MGKVKRKTSAHRDDLPKRAPRKSGRRGIGPKEEVESGESETGEVSVSKPRQGRLAGMEDAKIEEIEAAAESYAEIRDRRQALTAEEVPAKKKLLELMHANEKTSYHHNGIEVKVVVEKEKVKVKIKKDSEEE